jgi:enoyl-CoA hydratase
MAARFDDHVSPGQSHALDMILNGRGVGGIEAAQMGLVNRLVATGGPLLTTQKLAAKIARVCPLK